MMYFPLAQVALPVLITLPGKHQSPTLTASRNRKPAKTAMPDVPKYALNYCAWATGNGHPWYFGTEVQS